MKSDTSLKRIANVAVKPDEDKITPEMIEAGVAELEYRRCVIGDHDVVVAVYNAMRDHRPIPGRRRKGG
jgi:hypothetical protein